MKKCTYCQEEKSLDMFGFNKTKNIYDSRCKKCKSFLQTERQKQNSDYPEVQRRSRLKHRYNVTPEWYDAQLERQGGRCAICKTDSPQGKSKKYFSVDHDHGCCPGTRSCGNCVRGLLCIRCNNSLGWYETNTEAMTSYLHK